jgi:redox-sensitive bicupin YhaK (pirin superfamily)
MQSRKISKILRVPYHNGFLGNGHKAKAVLDGLDFKDTDPFIMLMDDVVDLPGGEPAGGPHPHAGFETVTLVLEGDERHFKTGSMEIMTAGKGIIHTEEIITKTKMRILQLWLVLPPQQRWAEPFLQVIHEEDVPTIRNTGYEIKVYSGSSQGLSSPVQNQTPVTLADFRLEKEVEISQEIPASYSGFIYVLSGKVSIGDSIISEGETAWMDSGIGSDISQINFRSVESGTRFILYAGEPQKAAIVSYGPFIANTSADIHRLYDEYRTGKIPHLNDIPDSRKVVYKKEGQLG